MFTTALFIETKKWKQPMCSSTGEGTLVKVNYSVEWKKPVIKITCCMSSFSCNYQHMKFVKTESRLVIVKGREWKCWQKLGVTASLRVNKMFQNQTVTAIQYDSYPVCMWVTYTVNINMPYCESTENHWNTHFKWVNFNVHKI